MTFESVSDVLRYLFDKYGAGILNDPHKFVSMFADLMPEAEVERRLIKTACESGVYMAFISAPENERQNCVTRSIHKLSSSYAIAPVWATSIMSWLCDALEYNVECVAPDETLSETPSPAAVSFITSLNVFSNNHEPLLQRALLSIEDGEWGNADKYCERVLDDNPTNAYAYLIKLLIERKAHSVDELLSAKRPLSEGKAYGKLERFADAELFQKIQQINTAIVLRNEEERCSNIYRNAKKLFDEAVSPDDIGLARKQFLSISSFKDAAALADRCLTEWADRKQKTEKDLEMLRILDEGPTTIGKDEQVLSVIDSDISKLEDVRRELVSGTTKLPTLEEEKNRIYQKISRKQADRSALGLFSGKQKKALSLEIADLY